MSNNERRWFKPRKETGWKKTQKPATRRRVALSATDKRLTLHNRYLQAARRLQALANVTQDKVTREKAQRDANHFFKKAKKKG